MRPSRQSSVRGRARKSRPESGVLKRAPGVEALERRVVLASAIPATALTVPAQAMIGSTVNFTVGFSNASPTQAGYGPYIDLDLPPTGTTGPRSSTPPTSARR